MNRHTRSIVNFFVLTATGLLAGCTYTANQTHKGPQVHSNHAKVESEAHHLPVASAQSLKLSGATPVRWQVIGESTEDRAITATTLGHGIRKLFLIGGIHGDEPEGLYIFDDLVRSLASDSGILSRWTLRIVRDMNPDGTEKGSRFNARGVDLNRNWPTSNFKKHKKHGMKPLSEVETKLVHAEIESFQPDLFIVFHSTRRGPFVNFDGPARQLTEVWVKQANVLTDDNLKPWKVVPSMGYPTPGSLGTFAGVDRQLPILTVEFLMGQSPDLYHEAALAGLTSVLKHE